MRRVAARPTVFPGVAFGSTRDDVASRTPAREQCVSQRDRKRRRARLMENHEFDEARLGARRVASRAYAYTARERSIMASAHAHDGEQ